MQRLVTSMPLGRLWKGDAFLDANRGASIGASRVRELLRTTEVPLVIATMYAPLTWIFAKDRFEMWKSTIQPRLSEPEVERISPDSYQDGRCFIATEWSIAGEIMAILFEELH